MEQKTAKTKEVKETPLMQQYNSFKAKYPGALLLFRVGDFYETFGEDAITASRILGITLTKRANGSASHIELAGFPHHSIETYLPKLVRAGQRVAICDQLEDPKMTKTIVKRGVTEVVTPGVSYNDNILQYKSNNYLAALHFEKEVIGIAFLDISTGEFLTAQGNADYIDKLLQGFKPSEVIFSRKNQKDFLQTFGDKFYTYSIEDWVFGGDYASEILLKHFETVSLKGFGIENLQQGIIAAGACMHYVHDAQHTHVPHITSIARIEEEQFVWLDRFTIRNLELIYSPNEDAVPLIQVLDATSSPMGARLLHKWMVMPLKDKIKIEERLEVVEFLVKQLELAEKIQDQLKQCGDLERLIAKVALQKANPREVLQLSRALTAIEHLKELCAATGHWQFQKIAEQLNPCMLIREKISSELQADPPVVLARGGVIAAGVSAELDELRSIAFSGKDYLLAIQKREIENTGITSLKVAFNSVFGYYLEVTHSHKDKVPAEWIRKQTLVNAERYITPELKTYEEKILGAEEKIQALESGLYAALVTNVAEYIQPIQLNAWLLAQLDVLHCFATTAVKNNYVKPEITEENVLDIKSARHPVIEKRLAVGEEYIPNDVYLDTETQQIIIITGPNMSGKSAILRQTGLIVLMAQMGCFVPAKSARIGLVDKVFTRVGASDNLSSGESTFMVEMNETASILNNLSDRSLILLDEIGRGTSTYDGISIAWSIAEYLHEHPTAKPKTLFATHYHELNEMATTLTRIKNFNVSIKEVDNRVIFLRKLIPGGSEHSFGIHVAKMAGMPPKVLSRANQVLKQLEDARSSGATDAVKTGVKKAQKNQYQMQMFSLDDPILISIRDTLNNLEVNTLTPVEALMKLDEIQRLLKK